MGDRANIYLEMSGKDDEPGGIYLYTHYSGYEWPERLREALAFGHSRWSDEQYLARIITSRVFTDVADSDVGGGVSLQLCDNEHPIIVCDLIGRQVSFAEEGAECDPTRRYGHMSFQSYIEQDQAGYPDETEGRAADSRTCSLRYSGCTTTASLVEDPYRADVGNNPGQMILACDHCLQELCNDI